MPPMASVTLPALVEPVTGNPPASPGTPARAESMSCWAMESGTLQVCVRPEYVMFPPTLEAFWVRLSVVS